MKKKPLQFDLLVFVMIHLLYLPYLLYEVGMREIARIIWLKEHARIYQSLDPIKR